MIHGLESSVSWGKINQNWPRELRDSNMHAYYSYWVIEKYLWMDKLGQIHRCCFRMYIYYFFAVKKGLSCKSLISL